MAVQCVDMDKDEDENDASDYTSSAGDSVEEAPLPPNQEASQVRVVGSVWFFSYRISVLRPGAFQQQSQSGLLR
jgi:hypothetical protein